jgi:hypothetical protein
MANCNTIVGISKGCEANNVGGIYEVYVIDSASVTATTISSSAHTITNLGVSEDFTTFQFKRNVGNFVTEETKDLLVGSNIVKGTLTLQFSRREGSKSRAFTILGEGQRFLDIIIKGADGTYTYVKDAQLMGVNEDTGTLKADGTKYTVTFTNEEANYPYFVDSAIVAALIS